ncbi:MAG: hypothetical protein ABIN95_04745 [Mucilaginibacter sp.]
MATYNADQIIGKSLIAKKPVVLKRTANDSAKTIYTVPVGGTVGVVYSYIGGGSAPLWWMFYDSNQATYYAKHESGLFDLDVLKDQGALDTKEQADQEKQKEADQSSMFPSIPNPFDGFGKSLEKTLQTVAIVAAAVLIGSMLLKSDK